MYIDYCVWLTSVLYKRWYLKAKTSLYSPHIQWLCSRGWPLNDILKFGHRYRLSLSWPIYILIYMILVNVVSIIMHVMHTQRNCAQNTILMGCHESNLGYHIAPILFITFRICLNARGHDISQPYNAEMVLDPFLYPPVSVVFLPVCLFFVCL